MTPTHFNIESIPRAAKIRPLSLMDFLERQSRPRIMVMSLALLALVATADYVTGFELSFSAFYLVPISLATWFLGWRLGIVVSVISVACDFAGDLAAGAMYPNKFVPMWNAVITLTFFLVLVGALSSLRELHQQLGTKVRERTAALRLEMAEREHLEKAVLVISEREQQRIGHDLHDSLCQHLTGVALVSEVLGGKLEAKSLPETADAARIVTLIEDGIELARNIARGLAPVDLGPEGLMGAFREFAKATSERFNVECALSMPAPVLVNDPVTAMQLFRIAQEAVANAIKHGHARHITLGLKQEPAFVELTVRDDGTGLPDPLPDTRGMGLHIMRRRATMIGASFKAERMAQGTLVTCRTGQLPTEDDL